ncbi:MAG TPA: 2,3-diaminopropionate biosynthesis protein SbnB [Patescibacteria group bacterium]|nr:2,3-diaminopropionate biosynthesis protein SbnB [Patescibacteria group bacterium]
MQSNDNLLVIGGQDIAKILDGQELAIIDIIKATYEAHAKAQTSVPHSIFLRFPDRPQDRIIGLPAYVGGEQPIAGMKWVASFPGNIKHELPRASASLVLNSMDNGRPYAFLEASLINMQRTAASAALAAKMFCRQEPKELSLIGCGPINLSVCRFVKAALPSVTKVRLYDLDQARAESFAKTVTSLTGCEVEVAASSQAAIQDSLLISFGTTAAQPYLDDAKLFADNSVVLHVSLRDLAPSVITSATNVVDDLDHVNREETSIYLTAQELGRTDFVTANIGDLLVGTKSMPTNNKPIIFSPFGLGILDVKLGQYVYDQAQSKNIGQTIANFFPNA